MSHQLSDSQTKSLPLDKQPSADWGTLTEVEQLEAIDRLLGQTLYRSLCPSAEILSDFDAKMLPDEEVQAVATHLETCEHCSAELADLRTHLAEFPEPTSIEPPSIWQRMKTLVATQLPRIGTPALGLKASPETVQPNLQYIYIVQANASIPIIIDVEADSEHYGQYKLIGQSALESANLFTVFLWREGDAEPIANQIVSDLGEFQFVAVETGQYEIILSNGQTDVCLRDITV